MPDFTELAPIAAPFEYDIALDMGRAEPVPVMRVKRSHFYCDVIPKLRSGTGIDGFGPIGQYVSAEVVRYRKTYLRPDRSRRCPRGEFLPTGFAFGGAYFHID